MFNKSIDEMFIDFFGTEAFSAIEEINIECYADNHDIDMVTVDELGHEILRQDVDEGFPELDVKIGELTFEYESPARKMQLSIRNLVATVFLISIMTILCNFTMWLIMWMAQ